MLNGVCNFYLPEIAWNFVDQYTSVHAIGYHEEILSSITIDVIDFYVKQSSGCSIYCSRMYLLNDLNAWNTKEFSFILLSLFRAYSRKNSVKHTIVH